MDPTTALIMAGGSVLASAVAPVPAAPVMGGDVSTDHSGWNIAFPGARIDAVHSTAEGVPAENLEMRQYMLYFGLAAGVILLWKLVKK